MNNKKTLKLLNKLANQLDEIGRQPEANFVDKMISKLAQENLIPIGKPYKDGDKYFQRFDAGSKGLIIKEVNPDGSLISAPVATGVAKPLDKMKPTPPPSEDSWEAWFRKRWPGLLPALQSEPEEAIEEQQANQAKDEGENKVEKLIKEIQDRYNKLRETGWTPPKKIHQADVVEYEDPDEEETELILSEDPDDLPTRIDLLNNVDFENMPDFTGDQDWADVSMWQDGNPVDNRFPL